ncbi:hypothetical protein HN937_03925 [Candidatus Poribacteria bacterium]|jgi:hypothetical protein|nr:hypothetical protein [Candidatus Poribacteria bacterium]
MSGEKQDDRKVMSNNVRDMVASGVKPDKARQMARESMIRVDRRQREEGKR